MTSGVHKAEMDQILIMQTNFESKQLLNWALQHQVHTAALPTPSHCPTTNPIVSGFLSYSFSYSLSSKGVSLWLHTFLS